MSPPSDRKLRRLVADLAGATPEDIQAVLSGLEESQRERVEGLLAEFAGDEPPRPVRAAAPRGPARRDGPSLDGLSPWLLDRLARAGLTAADAAESLRIWTAHDLGFGMTPTATDALRKAALELRAEQGARRGDEAGRPGWLSRLLTAVGGMA